MTNLNTSIPDAVEDNRSSYALPIWNYLIDEIGPSGDVHQGEIAEDVSCSLRTVQRVLKGFRRCHLIKWESYRGQGRGIKIINHWLQKAKKIAEKLTWKRAYQAEARYLKNPYSGEFQLGTTRLDYLSIPNKVVTKGSAIARLIMWKLRTWVEDTHLKDQANIICGKLFDYFEGRSLSVAKKFLSRLKDSMLIDWSLTDFFVWLYDLISARKDREKATKRTEKMIEEKREQRAQVRKQYQSDSSPPRSEDFPKFGDYLQAMENWSGEG